MKFTTEKRRRADLPPQSKDLPPQSKDLPPQSKAVLVARAGDLERLGKEFFPHLVARCRRELIETVFGLRGYVLVIKP